MEMDQTGGDLDSFLSSLVEFCVDSVSLCLSPDADRRCVPVGLSCLSALLVLLSCCLPVCQRCATPGGESSRLLYSLLGGLCSSTGAVLSRQLHIQVLMAALSAATDAVSLMSCWLHVLLSWNSKTEKRRRMMRRRRRQHLLAVCVLMVVAGGFLKSGVTQHPEDRPLIRRRLLQAALQDNTEILGYVLGLLSFVIASTSRFPSLCRASRGQMLTWTCMVSGLLWSAAGVLYAAAILLYDTQLGFLLRVLPWLLSAVCCAVLDLLILVIHCWKRGTRQTFTGFPSDTERLLPDDNDVMKRPRQQQLPSSVWTKTNQKLTEMGHYMDISVQPAGKICLKEVTLSKKKEEMEEVEEEEVERPLNRTVRVTRVDSFCSSDSSCESSPVSSDLEVGSSPDVGF